MYIQTMFIQMTVEEVTKADNITIEKRTALNVLITQNELSEHLNEILKRFDISAEQFNVLRILRGQNKPTNMFTIQDRMIAKKSNTTRLVDKLLLKNFVIREVCTENRRKIEVAITPGGLQLLTTLDPLVASYEKIFADKLTADELITLNKLLEKYRI